MYKICMDIFYLIHFPCFFTVETYVFIKSKFNKTLLQVNLIRFTEGAYRLHINHISLMDINIVRFRGDKANV